MRAPSALASSAHPSGNLADYGYDLGAAFRSDAMRQEVHAIGGGHRADCFCTHTCFLLSSMKLSPKTLLYRIPRAYLAYRRAGAIGGPLSPGPGDLADLERRYGLVSSDRPA